MKVIGIIETYNGKYGTIDSREGIVDFEANDISLNQEVNIGDRVEFRIEEKYPDIKIARNITKRLDLDSELLRTKKEEN